LRELQMALRAVRGAARAPLGKDCPEPVDAGAWSGASRKAPTR